MSNPPAPLSFYNPPSGAARMVLAAWQIAQAADPISGGAGWVGAGLLGLVLGWLLLKHLPDKDAQTRDFIKNKDDQLREILEAQSAERNADRTTRHDLAGIFQKSISEIEDEHRRDAEKDRQAFMDRNSRLEDAIRTQTVELKAAIALACRYDQQPDGGK